MKRLHKYGLRSLFKLHQQLLELFPFYSAPYFRRCASNAAHKRADLERGFFIGSTKDIDIVVRSEGGVIAQPFDFKASILNGAHDLALFFLHMETGIGFFSFKASS